MTITMIRIMFILGIAGHALNMYCDRILSVFPNGTIKFDNISKIKKDGVLAKLLEGVSASVPMRSGVLGAFALFLEYLSYVAFSIYTYEYSHVLGMIMFATSAFFCIVGAAHHIKTAMAEYVFLKLGRDDRGKELLLDIFNSASILRSCIVSLLVYLVALAVAILTGTIGFPIWAILFTILPIFIIMFPFKIVGTLHIAAMISMLAWIFLV